jgi:hypothetical protein
MDQDRLRDLDVVIRRVLGGDNHLEPQSATPCVARRARAVDIMTMEALRTD